MPAPVSAVTLARYPLASRTSTSCSGPGAPGPDTAGIDAGSTELRATIAAGVRWGSNPSSQVRWGRSR
ncbi:hypothetical protein ACFPRL_15275 [Pseudoclavibacter helvolus]